jgi:hypothetical protein
VIIVHLRWPFDQEKGSRTRKAINVMTPKDVMTPKENTKRKESSAKETGGRSGNAVDHSGHGTSPIKPLSAADVADGAIAFPSGADRAALSGCKLGDRPQNTLL